MCTRADMELYRQRGYIVLDGIFSNEEMGECIREYDAMFERATERGDRLEATWKGNWKTEEVCY
jgi:hypothetical protein